MNNDYSFGAFLKHHNALGDVTNHNGKRGLLLNLDNSVSENENGQLKKGDGKARKDELPSWVYLGSENLDKGKENAGPLLTMSANAVDGVDRGLPFLKSKRICHSLNPECGLQPTQETVASDENKEPQSSLKGDLHFVRGDSVIHGIMEGEGSRDSCMSSISVPAQCDKATEPSPVLENAIGIEDVNETLVRHASGKNEKGQYGQFLGSNSGSYECIDSQLSAMGADAIPSQESLNKPSLTGPLGSKVVDVKLKANCSSDDRVNTNDSLGSEKACSCYFCVKAAYLWSDLHYQDAKGRLAALTKSMKHVRLLVRNYNHDDIQNIARGSSNPKLEFDLMNQWKSLFRHTDDILVRESTQLQSNLLRLKELRGNCERDLEIAARAHSDQP